MIYDRNVNLIKSLFFLLLGGSVLLAFVVFLFYRYQETNNLWRSELTEKSILALKSFSAGLTREEEMASAVASLKRSIEEFTDVSIYRRDGSEFTVVASSTANRVGGIVVDVEEKEKLSQALELNEAVAFRERNRSGLLKETQFIDVYTPSTSENYFLSAKFSVTGLESRRNQENRREYLILFALAIIFCFYIIFSFLELYHTLNLYLLWRESAKNKDNLLSMASHEINAPLTAIKASLSVYRDTYWTQIPEGSKFLIEKALNINQGLINLVENILAISRFERGRVAIFPRPIDLAEATNEVADLYRERIASKNMKLTFVFPPNLPKIVADPDRIKEIIGNLISNGIKYSKTRIAVTLDKDAEFVYFHIKDDGEGIEENNMSKLFQRFSRLKTSGRERGTGLGLYISKLIIEAHKGKIWAESTYGRGSCFSFCLPIRR